MPDLPVMLRLQGKRALVAGGGPAAAHRARSLLAAGAMVTVVAPEVVPGLADRGAEVHLRRWEPGDLEGMHIAVVATSNDEVNRHIGREAKARGILVNRADDPTAGDFTVLAHDTRGPVTVAVGTGGISASAAATIRDELLEHLDPAWIGLLDVAAEYRDRLQAEVPAPERRRAALLRLADAEAHSAYRKGGREALVAHLDRIFEEATS